MHQRLRTDYSLVVQKETVQVIIKALDPYRVQSRESDTKLVNTSNIIENTYCKNSYHFLSFINATLNNSYKRFFALAIYLFLAISIAFLPHYSLMLSTSFNVIFTYDPTSYVAFLPPCV